MPLTPKGTKIMRAMKGQYGEKKGESVFYASRNKGNIKGVEKGGGFIPNPADVAMALQAHNPTETTHMHAPGSPNPAGGEPVSPIRVSGRHTTHSTDMVSHYGMHPSPNVSHGVALEKPKET